MGPILAFLRRHALAWLGLALLIVRVPLGSAHEPFNPHRVSFCIAPAFYRFGEGLIPGIDLFSQYGLGQGFFFHWFLADTARATVDRFMLVHLAAVLAFFVAGYHLTARLLRSRAWAFAVCAVGVVGQFGGFAEFSVIPSMTAYRVVFVVPVAALFVWTCAAPANYWRAALLGGALGVAVFWQTDAGLALGAAALGTPALLVRPLRRAARMAAVLAVSAAGSFFLLSLLAYGPGTLRVEYLRGMVAPFFWYFGRGEFGVPGFSSTTLPKHSVTIVMLVGAMAALAVLPARARGRAGVPVRVSGIAFLASACLLLHGKFVIRPLEMQYWSGQAFPALVVFAWLAIEVLTPLARRAVGTLTGGGRPALERRAANVLVAAICLLGAAWLPATQGYTGYPSLLNRAVWPAESFAPLPSEAPEACSTAADLALIHSNTQPGERVTVISPIDWAYLLEARRPPRYFILPVMTGPEALNGEVAAETLASRVVFLDKRVGSAETSLEFLSAVVPDWRQRFRRADESEHLMLLVRNEPPPP